MSQNTTVSRTKPLSKFSPREPQVQSHNPRLGSKDATQSARAFPRGQGEVDWSKKLCGRQMLAGTVTAPLRGHLGLGPSFLGGSR